MRLTLNSNCVLKSDRLSVGYCEENKAETLNIFIQNEKLYDKEIRLEFQVNNGKKYTTEELELLDGHIEYSLPNGLLSESGTLSLQLVFRDQNGLVKKSNVLKLHIHKSICAGDDLVKEYPDFIGEAQEVINELKNISTGLKLVERLENVDVLQSADDWEHFVRYKLDRNKFKPNATYLIKYCNDFCEPATCIINTTDYHGQTIGTVFYDQGTSSVGSIWFYNHPDYDYALTISFSTTEQHVDELTLIEIYELCSITKEEEKLVQYDMSHYGPDEYGVRNLTLTNGTYVIYNSLCDTERTIVMIDFGKCKDMDCGKFINFGSGMVRDLTTYIHNFSSGYDEGNAYISIDNEAFVENKNIYIIVRDNDVFINLTEEV